MRILLQLGEVTRSKKAHATSAEVINDCSGECRPFSGISPRPCLIKKDQITALRPRMNPQDGGEVSGEG